MLKWLGISTAVLLLITILIPNSRTVAAMYVIPKVLDGSLIPETVSKESKEMYDIVKQSVKKYAEKE